jgi:hypothetical protein
MHQLSDWQIFYVGRHANSTDQELAKAAIKQGIDQVYMELGKK